MTICAFHPIRLQDSLTIKISGKNQAVYVFYMELVIKERGHLKLLTLAETSEATNCGQLCFLSDEIARLNIYL